MSVVAVSLTKKIPSRLAAAALALGSIRPIAPPSPASCANLWARTRLFFFFQAEDGIRDLYVTGVQTCALPILVDAAGQIVMVNAKTEQMFGYSRQELIGQGIDILVPPRFRDKHPAFRRAFAADPGARAMGTGRDLFGRRKDNSEFPVEVGLNPIETHDGWTVLSVIVDISERKRAELLAANQTRELERSNAELEEFAYVAAHELLEPLRTIASYAHLLAERYQGKLDEQADKYIQ